MSGYLQQDVQLKRRLNSVTDMTVILQSLVSSEDYQTLNSTLVNFLDSSDRKGMPMIDEITNIEATRLTLDQAREQTPHVVVHFIGEDAMLYAWEAAPYLINDRISWRGGLSVIDAIH